MQYPNVYTEYNGDKDSLRIRNGKVLGLLREPLTLGDNTILPTVSVGIACSPKDGETFSELYQNADKALYRVKSMGKNSFCIYSA